MISNMPAGAMTSSAKRIGIGAAFFLCGICMLLSFTLCIYTCIPSSSHQLREVRTKSSKLNNHIYKINSFLVVLVITKPTNHLQRSVIRQTWLKQVHEDVSHFFVIGTKSLKDEDLSLLHSENSRFNDVMLLHDVVDNYTTLTQKVLSAFNWANVHLSFKFLLKADDDSFARIDMILDELKLLGISERYYWGFFDGRAHVKKSGPWMEKDWILCDRYLPYALGGGYILSADLINFIATNRHMLKQFKSEDVSVGTWLSGLDIQRIHDTRFDTEYKSRGCHNSYLVTHKQNVDQMREKYRLLQATEMMCSSEHQERYSYNYNWDVPPTLCCVRNDSTIP